MSTEGAGEALGASYRLNELLGRGATGEVWRATDRRTDEVVAAKLLRSEHTSDQDLVGRFVRERSILTGLRHPQVVAVRDLVVEGDRLAIIMDFVDGGSLRDVLAADGTVPPERAAAVVAAVLDGLAAAHASGILHRDVKPDNVLLTSSWQDLSPGAVRLTDFGISRMVAEGAGTTTGLMGTPEYMAPELLVTGTCDYAADVYGAGILLYELLAGRTPFSGPGTDYTVAHRHVASVPPPLDVPAALAAQLDALLAKDPTARPSAAEAAAGLRRVAPALAGLPALERQGAPSDFDSARGPMTMLRGVTPEPEPTAAADDEDDAPRPSSLDLGTPDHGTMLRPMAVPDRPAPRKEADPVRSRKKQATPRWRDPRAIGVVALALLLLGGAVAYAATTGGSTPEETDDGPVAAAPVSSTKSDQPTVTGLTVGRQATYDPESETIELALTYQSQSAPLRGPFLEVLPETDGGDCPTVTWAEGDQPQDERGNDGLGVECGWAVDPGPIEARSSVTLTATVGLALDPEDPAGALDAWMTSAQERMQAALTDSEVRSTAYPVQRLTGVFVQAPLSVVSGAPVDLSILPVWPSGEDRLNPLFTTTNVGAPTILLTSIAGGLDGVRFSDSCSGGVLVSGGGLQVTAGRNTTECTVLTTVGNIPDTPSTPFDVTGRNS